MSSYIHDYNNAESIANDSTVLNATNYGNLTYKVDELQFITNELYKYNHKTILASIKDTWEDEGWNALSSGGVKANDTTNYLLNGKSIKFTGDAQWDGIHCEKILDLEEHADGYACTSDNDLITFFCYIDSTSLANLTAGGAACEIWVGFYCDVFDTTNNYFEVQIDDRLVTGKNIIKFRKGDFDSNGVGADWSSIRGIDVYLAADDPDDEVTFSIDNIMLHSCDFTPFVIKTADETINNDNTTQLDDELIATLPQNGWFELILHMAIDANSDTSDFKLEWATTGDVAIYGASRFVHGPGENSTSIYNSDAIQLRASSSTGVITYGLDATGYAKIFERMILYTLDDGGTITAKWAQSTAEANDTVVKAGSYIKVTRIW